MPQYIVTYGSKDHDAEVRSLGGHMYEVTLDGETFVVDACVLEPSVCSVIVDGRCYEVHYSRDRNHYHLLIGSDRYEIEARNRRVRAVFAGPATLATGRQVIHAPMPGRVVRILAPPGQEVRAGDPVLTLEAMKMENQLRSPVDGRVAEISVIEGQVVGLNEKLAVVE